MKVKGGRKGARLTGDERPLKKRRKESEMCGNNNNGNLVASMITSSCRKRRIECPSQLIPLQKSTRVLPGDEGKPVAFTSTVLHCNEGGAAVLPPLQGEDDKKNSFAGKECGSASGTLFSPTFTSNKVNASEGSTSCSSTVEQADCPDESTDSSENKSASQEATALVPCSAFTGHCGASCEALACQTIIRVGEDCIRWVNMEDASLGGDHNQISCQLQEDDLEVDPAALFLSMQQCQNVEKREKEADDADELDNFDPYLFIKHLPDLSEVVAPCRPMLLPKQTRRCPPVTLVLDLDETLVHSTLEHCPDADFTFPVYFSYGEQTVYVRRRPHLQVFLEKVAQMFEIIIFTASQSVYAEQLLNILDPKRKLIRHRIFRDSCVFVDGNYLKDLSILGRDLAKVAIVDNSPQAFGFQIDNGIPIDSWFDDRNDCALLMLLPFLEKLATVDDVRPVIAKRFNLRRKIAAAAEPGLVVADRSLEQQQQQQHQQQLQLQLQQQQTSTEVY